MSQQMQLFGSGPRDIQDPADGRCEDMVVFAPLGSAILEPDNEWVDA